MKSDWVLLRLTCDWIVSKLVKVKRKEIISVEKDNKNVTEKKRPTEIRFRATDDEYDYVKALADRAGLSVNKFTKNTMLNVKYKPLKFSKEDTLLIAKELTKQGNNLNQIARSLNSMNARHILSTQKTLESVNHELHAVRMELKKIWEQL